MNINLGMTSRILFITRNYPPIVGGLEKYSFHLIEAFSSNMPTHKITLSKPKKHLIWFLPYALLSAFYAIQKHHVLHVHLCDGLLAPIGLVIKRLTGVRVSVTIHGLDITYNNPLYQGLIPGCIEKLDKIVCVSRSTFEEVLKRTKPSPDSCAVIPNGIQPNEMCLNLPKKELVKKFRALTHIGLSNRKVLFTLGHLVKRKGVNWFVENVVPKLPQGYVYLIAGEGPERNQIEKTVQRYHLENRVFILGEISDEVRNIIYNLADLFVMPNITVSNDTEGFGIVAIEAGSCGLPVVASNIQGVRDAVIHGRTGYLIEERDVEGFVRAITEMSLQKEPIRKKVNETFGWEKIFEEYRRVLFSRPCPGDRLESLH